jgi:FtsP/CotA-like multicopper oxidase with cupredoxin domain
MMHMLSINFTTWKYFLLGVMFAFCLDVDGQQTVRYDIYLRDTIVKFAEKERRAISANGQIPMPTLVFTEGDTAEIHVHNLLDEDTSIHWHGLFLPNLQDGVPWLTQEPIKPKSTWVYRFPLIQNGTHWYHSHSGLQEQIGMYGSFIIEKRSTDQSFRKGIDDLPTASIVISEWTNLNPNNIHRMLHNANDYPALKKNSVQSYAEAIKAGHFRTKIKNEWKRMLAMDVSDVYYERILVNGQPNMDLKDASGKRINAGDKVRLRISNGGASSYFWMTYAGGKITVVANDGNDVEPIEVDRLIIAVSETFDVIVTVPVEQTAFEFLVTTEDRTNSASIFIGSGVKQLESPLPRLSYFEGMAMMNDMMKMNGDLDDMGMRMSLNQMDMNVVMYPEITGSKVSDKSDGNDLRYTPNALADIVTLNYAMLKATERTSLPANAPTKELRFALTGNMNRYVWSLNNEVVSEADKILIGKGENVRIVLYNGSMMRHPMHLHGHDFRLLNGKGEYAPLKNVVDIMPMETDTLEFQANAAGDWYFHCHILYHMMSGMGRVFTYQDSKTSEHFSSPNKALRKLYKDDRSFHFMFDNDFASNGNDGEMMLQNTRWKLQTEWRLGYTAAHGYESETHAGRYLGKMQYLFPYIGFDWRYRKAHAPMSEENLFGQSNTKDARQLFCFGIQYTLPMLLIADIRMDASGQMRLQIMREDIPITKRIRMKFMYNSDLEYMIGLRYVAGKNWGFTTHYDSDMGLGIGMAWTY